MTLKGVMGLSLCLSMPLNHGANRVFSFGPNKKMIRAYSLLFFFCFPVIFSSILRFVCKIRFPHSLLLSFAPLRLAVSRRYHAESLQQPCCFGHGTRHGVSAGHSQVGILFVAFRNLERHGESPPIRDHPNQI